MEIVPRRGKNLDWVPATFADFNRWVDEAFNRWFAGEPAAKGVLSPAIDIYETEKDVVVNCELPGVDVKDVKLSIENNVLTLSAEKSEEEEKKDRNYHWVERRYGTYARSIVLPKSADTEKVEAEYENGVLTITIPKKPEEQTKKVEIKTKKKA